VAAGSVVSRRTGVEVVAIGTELLLGDTLDTNGAWLGRRLAPLGIPVVRRTIVGDDAAAIQQAVSAALANTGIVVCSGGLGPTRDDVTKRTIAALYGRALRRDEIWLAELRRRYAARGAAMPVSNETQALVPEGAVFFANAHGTAPGLALEDERGITIMLPGVPHEFRGLNDDHVVAWLETRIEPRAGPVRSRLVRITGIPESAVGERVDDVIDAIAPLTIAFLPSFAGTDVRVTSWGEQSAAQADSALDQAEALIRARLGDHVYGVGQTDLAAVVGAELRARGFTVVAAESCTGGLIAKRLTDAAGASDYFTAGVVAYHNTAKLRLLGVRAATIEAYGAVSEAAVREMLDGARQSAAADCAIAVTGIAGPGGGTAEKPVGTVWIGAATPQHADLKQLHLRGDRTEIRERSAQAALDLLRRLLLRARSESGGPRPA
jgi:nicotinamide-nucleotide amidase